MQPISCAGMQLVDGLTDGDAALEALVCIKVIAEDGGVDWKVLATPGLHTVEAMGAAAFAQLVLGHGAFIEDD